VQTQLQKCLEKDKKPKNKDKPTDEILISKVSDCELFFEDE